MNYYSDESEWKWLFKNAINWKEILPLYYPNYPTEEGLESEEEVLGFLEELLTNTGQWTGTSLTERRAYLDKEGAGTVKDGRTITGKHLQKTYDEAREMELFAMTTPREWDGLETPESIHMLLLGQLSRACLSTSTQLAFFTSISAMIHRFCPKKFQDKYIPMIRDGKISGSMCLTEPGAGSDLGDLRTSASPQEDGTYLINGSKIFITNGGGGLHFTLARIKGAPEGLAGISLFFIEQEIEGQEKLNYEVVKNEEKMGLHGSFTTEILYENSKGYLVGEANAGFKYMLHLMNEARIAVALQAFGGIEASLDYARKYAEERKQFGKPIAELPLMARNLKDFETERDAIRAMLVDTVSHYDIYQRLSLKKRHTGDLTKEEQEKFERAELWTRKRTPLTKFYACEALSRLSTKAIQVLGGYGFMQEYPLEQIHRDSFGPLLYEGTSQIQSLMALKDLVKYVAKDPTGYLNSMFSQHPLTGVLNKDEKSWEKDFKAAHFKFKKNVSTLIVKNLRPEMNKIFNLKNWMAEEKINGLMEHAETLCEGLSYFETLRVLRDHAYQDSSRAQLFQDYLNLVGPRLEGIYEDWSIRSS